MGAARPDCCHERSPLPAPPAGHRHPAHGRPNITGGHHATGENSGGRHRRGAAGDHDVSQRADAGGPTGPTATRGRIRAGR